MLHLRPPRIDQAVAFGANRGQYPRFLIPSPSVLGEGRVGVQAVLNLLENRFCLKQRFPIREAVVKTKLLSIPCRVREAESSRKNLDEEASRKNRDPALPRSTPTPTLPQDTGEGVQKR